MRSTFTLFARNELGHGDARLTLRELAQLIIGFCFHHNVHLLLVSHACTLVGCMLVLGPGWLPDPACATPVDTWFKGGESGAADLAANVTLAMLSCGGEPAATIKGADGEAAPGLPLEAAAAAAAAGSGGLRGRHLKGTSITGVDASAFEGFPISDEGEWAWLWLTQGLALGLLTCHLAFNFARPFERLHVLLTTILNVLFHDFATYLAAFAAVLFGFFVRLTRARAPQHKL